MREEIELARQWLTKADNDLLNADNNLASENIPFDTVCFHCQQAAEKFLKAYSISDDGFSPSVEDANEAREAVGQVMEWLDTLLPELFQNVSVEQSEDQEIQNHEQEH